MKLPKLFKLTSTGALQEWSIETKGNCIITVWGQVDGALQDTLDIIKEGKNEGKTNATTPEQQAEAEAQSQWEKKLKKGYVQNIKDAKSGKVDSSIKGGIFPMLAKNFEDHEEKVVYPCYVGPKLDGHRMIAVIEDHKATLWSRTRKPITGLPHIIKALEDWSIKHQYDYIVLDGEAYNHDYKNNFEDLTSFIRSSVPKPGHEVVQYHVYDVADIDDMVQFERLGYIEEIEEFNHQYLVAVMNKLVYNPTELMEAYKEFVAQGYEGAMVRSYVGLYVNKRSTDLLKMKEFQDAEFKIVAVEEGRGKLAGHAVFRCKTLNGTEFGVKLRGRLVDLKKYFQNPELAVGKDMTVQFQGYTKEGLPRFPVGLRVREEL